jgi:hypothetical protein
LAPAFRLPLLHENSSDLMTTGTTPGGEINSPTST